MADQEKMERVLFGFLNLPSPHHPLQHPPRTHRQLVQPHVDRVVNGVGDGFRWRNDGDLADAVGVVGVGDFDDDRVDHGEVQAGGRARGIRAGIGEAA
jgi:hypothetical protein